MKAILSIAALLLLANGIAAYRHTHRVCDGTKNFALCDLNLQAGKSDTVARNAGNHIFN